MTETGLLIPIAFEERPTAEGDVYRKTSFSNGLEVTEIVREGDPGLAIVNDTDDRLVPPPGMDRYGYSLNVGIRTVMAEVQPFRSPDSGDTEVPV